MTQEPKRWDEMTAEEQEAFRTRRREMAERNDAERKAWWARREAEARVRREREAIAAANEAAREAVRLESGGGVFANTSAPRLTADRLARAFAAGCLREMGYDGDSGQVVGYDPRLPVGRRFCTREERDEYIDAVSD